MVFLNDEVGQTSDEVTCLACTDSNLICIMLAGNYCHDVMDALNEFSKPLFFEPLEITALLAKGGISTNFTLITSLLHSTAQIQFSHAHRCEMSAGKLWKTTKGNFRQKKRS